jgi:hypothetical protein
MSDAQVLGAMGTDANKWAAEFMAVVATLDPDDVVNEAFMEGFMVTWFANAIEAGRDAGAAAGSATPTGDE